MSSYPDTNYAPPPNYDIESGTNCGNAKPANYWKAGNFCNDVEIQKDLSVLGTLTVPNALIGGAQFSPTETVISVPVEITAETVVKGLLKTNQFAVQEVEFRAVRLPPLDNYFVLAAYVPS